MVKIMAMIIKNDNQDVIDMIIKNITIILQIEKEIVKVIVIVMIVIRIINDDNDINNSKIINKNDR